MEDPIITNIPLEEKPKKGWVKFSLVLVGILIVPGSYYLWNYYLSPEARDARAFYRGVQTFQEIESRLLGDTYGGKTPQETVDMFISALEKGDSELAAKYFKRRVDGTEDPIILENIRNLQSAGGLPEIIDDLKSAKINPESDPITTVYDVFSRDNVLKYQFVLFKGSKTPVWKIEAL